MLGGCNFISECILPGFKLWEGHKTVNWVIDTYSSWLSKMLDSYHVSIFKRMEIYNFNIFVSLIVPWVIQNIIS